MLIVMTVGAEVFPIAAVRRVVVVVAIFMVHGQEMQVGEVELAAALGANPPVELQGTLPIIIHCLLLPFHCPHQLVQLLLALGRAGHAWSK